jgi:hypothetical protein
MRISGRVTQARLMREHLTLTRTITAVLGEPRLRIEDVIRNAGFTPTPLMILHHMNLGAPLVSEEARVSVTTSHVEEWHVDLPSRSEDWQRLGPPRDGIDERVFFHTAKPDSGGWAEATLTNEALAPLGLRGIKIRWLTAEEPRMWEWVFLASGAYVLGLEPTNAMRPGLEDALARGQRILAPGETVKMAVEFEVQTT